MTGALLRIPPRKRASYCVRLGYFQGAKRQAYITRIRRSLCCGHRCCMTIFSGSYGIGSHTALGRIRDWVVWHWVANSIGSHTAFRHLALCCRIFLACKLLLFYFKMLTFLLESQFFLSKMFSKKVKCRHFILKC